MFTIGNGSDGSVSTPQKLICRSPLLPCFSWSFLLTPALVKARNTTHLNSATMKQGSLTLCTYCSLQCVWNSDSNSASQILLCIHITYESPSAIILVQEIWALLALLLLLSGQPFERKILEHYGCLCPALLCASCETLSKLHSLQSWFSICKRESLLLGIWNYCKGKLNSHKSS